MEIKEQIEQYISELAGQSDARVRFKLVDTAFASEESGVRLGTYGMIKGAPSFVVAVIGKEHGFNQIEKLGSLFERIVLFATSIGLGTCWVGGTLKREEFAKAISLKDDELLPVITPLGYASKGVRLQDAVAKMISGSRGRKGWEELFFNGDFHHSLDRSEASAYATALEMVRLAPSASNRQPWRIVKAKDAFDFYLSRTRGYKNLFSFDIQRIDIGIAMCHFELTSTEQGLGGDWTVKEQDIGQVPSDTEYIASWIAE
jgi:hypothetical protein